MGALVDNHPLVVFFIGAAILSIGVWVGGVNADRKDFKGFMKDVRKDLNKIISLLAKVEKKDSPTTLTALGNDISRMINAKVIAKNLSVKLAEKVKTMTPYEIQEFCADYISNDFKPSPDELVSLGNCAYKKGLPIESVYRVIVIELRDKLLETSP